MPTKVPNATQKFARRGFSLEGSSPRSLSPLALSASTPPSFSSVTIALNQISWFDLQTADFDRLSEVD